MFYLSFIVALLVSLTTTFFCVNSGAGAALDLLGACSLLLLVSGPAISLASLKRGSLISLLGISTCALMLLVITGELIHAIPLKEQSAQRTMIYVPLVLLGLLLTHVSAILSRLRNARHAELLAALSGKQQ